MLGGRTSWLGRCRLVTAAPASSGHGPQRRPQGRLRREDVGANTVKILDPPAQRRLMRVKITRCLRNADAARLDQPYRIKLELAAALPALHAVPLVR